MQVAQAADPALADRLEVIVWAQVTMAIVMVLAGVAILAAGIAVWLLARKAMREVQETRERLLPHITPVLGRAGDIAGDVRQITAGLRDDAAAVHDAVRDVLERSRQATDSLEERIRRFGLVLDVVQEQAEELLMDAASTAHGIHAAARALREEPSRVPPPAERGAAVSEPVVREDK